MKKSNETSTERRSEGVAPKKKQPRKPTKLKIVMAVKRTEKKGVGTSLRRSQHSNGKGSGLTKKEKLSVHPRPYYANIKRWKLPQPPHVKKKVEECTPQPPSVGEKELQVGFRKSNRGNLDTPPMETRKWLKKMNCFSLREK